MGMVVSQADMMRNALLQAKGERKTLEGRIATTKKSIEILETGLRKAEEISNRTNILMDPLTSAIIEAQLVQLRANLAEGVERIDYLNTSIAAAESPVKRAVIVPPGTGHHNKS